MDIPKVAVIGAGAGGLVSVKSCLEEGLRPTCFERSDDVGGVWRYNDERVPGQGACVYENLRTNTSKELMCLSDFPFPAETRAFPSHQEVLTYLNNYAETFDLLKHVKFNTTVVSIKKSKGKWCVSFVHRRASAPRNEAEGTPTDPGATDIQCEYFDAVTVCFGRNALENVPHFSGRESFKGQFLHSIDYRTANNEYFRDKKVLVIGNAHSAGDIAVASSNYSTTTMLSVGGGTWIVPRKQSNGLPFDLSARRCFAVVPMFIVNWIMKRHCNSRINHSAYHLSPSGPPTKTPIMVNDEIGEKIAGGDVVIKPVLIGFKGNFAVFNDGTEEEVDTVVVATGFQHDYKIVDVRSPTGNINDILYRQVWPVHLPHHSLAIIGCISIRGAVLPTIELQARWAARVFSGRTALPTESVMREEAKARTEKMRQWFGKDRLIPSPSALNYQDKLADEIGCKPTFFKLFCINPILPILCYFGPAFAVQYRLIGPHAWKGAVKATYDAYSNTMKGCFDERTYESRIFRNKLMVIGSFIVVAVGLGIVLTQSVLTIAVGNH